MHQILWMISSCGRHTSWGARWCHPACSCWGTSPAWASSPLDSCPRAPPSSYCRKNMERVSGYCKRPHKIAFVWRCISAFTLKTIIGKSCSEVASHAPLNWRQENKVKLLTNDETPPLGTRDHKLTAHIFLCCWGWAGKQELNDQNMHEPSYLLTKRTTTSAGCTHHKSQKTILASHVKKHFIVQSEWITLCTLIEGNMFWNMVAISLTCMPSMPKLFSTSKGWWENCCSCILCLFKDETISLMRVYWNKETI